MPKEFQQRERRTERLFRWVALLAFVFLITVWIFGIAKL